MSEGNEILKGVEGLRVVVVDPENLPTFESAADIFAFVPGVSSVDTSNCDSMFVTSPACPAAVIVKFVVPTSLARGVPESVRLLPSSDNQGGFPINEYCKIPESDENVVYAN